MVTELLVPFDSDVCRVECVVLDYKAQDTLGMSTIICINSLILLRVLVLIKHALIPINFDSFRLSLDKVKIGQILILMIWLVNIAHWHVVLLRLLCTHLSYLVLRDAVLVVYLLLIRVLL